MGANVDYRVAPNEAGTKISTMSVAVNFMSKGVEKVTWLRVKAFNGLADICKEHLVKGSRLGFVGHYQEDKVEEEGKPTKYYSYFVMDNLTMLGGTPAPDAQTEEEATEDVAQANQDNLIEQAEEALA